MKIETVANNLSFLSGTGEMATLTRTKDWSKTRLGDPAGWPQSLRTTLSILLNSKFPMFLWWGPDLICFYNDAYRPSLGQNGKHPDILGQKAEDAWPEIWDIIKPLIDQVLLSGEATWSEDQLIPIYRNGKVEDVYWTFSYSPVKDESGVAGVLVTCYETTDKVKILNEVREREDQLNFTLDAASLGTWDLDPVKSTFRANERLREWFGLSQTEEINLNDALNAISNQDRQRVINAISAALRPESGGDYEIEYSVHNLLDGKERVVIAKGKALFNADGLAYRFSGTMQDITDRVNARRKIEKTERAFRETVEQVSVGITIFKGQDFVVEMANNTYLDLVDRKADEFIGKPLFDSLPEVKEDVQALLLDVMSTGEPYYGTEFPVTLNRFGGQELAYFNFVYQPYKDDNGDIQGVIVVATDVTKSVNAKHSIQESEKQFRNLVMQSPIPMTIFRGNDHVIETANIVMLQNIWRKKAADVIGKKLLDVFPELREQKYPELLKEVLKSGQPYRENESVAYVEGDDGLKRFFLDYEYAPLFEPDGRVSGILITVNDVTEKVDARRKVEDAEQRLRLAVDATNLATWQLDLKTREILYTPRLAEIFGHESTAIITHADMRAQIHPDDRQRVVERAFETAYTTGIYYYEARVLKPGNTICWIRTQGKVIYDEHNKPVTIVGTLQDITEEKRHTQELEESEQKFRLLADSMPQFIWTSDADGNLNYFNRSVYDYSGLTKEQIAKDGWLQIVHPDDREKNVEYWTQAIETGEDFIFEHRFLRYDGVYHWQLSRAIPQKDDHGVIQMWVGTSTDIEDQKIFAQRLESQVEQQYIQLKQSGEELIKRDRLYQMMVSEVADYAIIFMSREGIIQNWNKGAEKIKGYTADEIIGNSFTNFYTEEDKASGLPGRLLKVAADTGKALQEGWRVRKDKSLFWASVTITAIHDQQGNVIGFSKVTRDLTEKRAAEDSIRAHAQQLEQKNKELEKMNAELKSFAYVSSHDLQEPLRKIQTFAGMVMDKESAGLTEKGRSYFQRMQEAAGRMQTLIEDLLAYSRTSSSDKVFVRTDLSVPLKEVINDLRDTIAEKNAVINVGPLCEANVILFQFRQLMFNLIGNSLKFAKPGQPPHIDINANTIFGHEGKLSALAPDKKYCHIRVSDNGIGFEPEYRDRIFEVFQRLHGKDEFKGTGIGLAIVKRIVENHDGVIVANGELGKGACFDIYLPA